MTIAAYCPAEKVILSDRQTTFGNGLAPNLASKARRAGYATFVQIGTPREEAMLHVVVAGFFPLEAGAPAMRAARVDIGDGRLETFIRGGDGKAYVLYVVDGFALLADAGPDEVTFMGSGEAWAAAYRASGMSVRAAVELVAKLHPDCGGAIQSL